MITPEDATNTTYSITVTCTIHPDSDADQCVVMAMADGQTLTGMIHTQHIMLSIRTFIRHSIYTVHICRRNIMPACMHTTTVEKYQNHGYKHVFYSSMPLM